VRGRPVKLPRDNVITVRLISPKTEG
jgi:hypothetical protein